MQLKGLSASRGAGVGAAKIVLSAADLTKVQQGDIMVVKHSNPAFATGLFKASAVISENGGMLFHLAILAREVGVPLVSGVENACKIIDEGKVISVNATDEEGVVTLDD
ncbi:MAG: hypothetical protein LBM38_03110 [Clostridiales bacterium]|jgi:pyruvate,water dikinase|nr:hypothetical protein [Clostridiales bacterium]